MLRRRMAGGRSALATLATLALGAVCARHAFAAKDVEASTFSGSVDRVLEHIGTGIEALGVAVIVVGGLAATASFFADRHKSGEWLGPYHRYRANLGRGILLGLEFLVAGDIVRTVAVDPTFESLGVLAGIILVRTFLSFALEVEIDGQWPWRKGKR